MLSTWCKSAVGGVLMANGSWPLSFFGSRIFCSGDSSGERGAPSIIFLAVSHTFQNFITLHTRTMAEKAAMVWSGTAAGITKIRRQRPQWTVMTSWCEGITAIALVAFILGVADTKWPLFWCKRNNSTAHSWTVDLWAVNTLPLLPYSIEVMM